MNLILELFTSAEDKKSAKCKECGKMIKTLGGSTSDLHTHQKTIHKKMLLKRVGTDVETESGCDSNLPIDSQKAGPSSGKKKSRFLTILRKILYH